MNKGKGGAHGAVVQEFVTEGGARVIICDDAYAGASAQEIARRVDAMWAAANRILYNYAARQQAAMMGVKYAQAIAALER